MPGRDCCFAAARREDVLKYNKRFTEGLGYFSCFLILVFIIYSYFKFGEPYLDESTGEYVSALTSVRGYREYLKLLVLLGGAAVISSSTDRLPFVGIAVSAMPVYYVLKLYADKLLVFCPMIIMVLIIFFFAGEIVATVQWAGSKLKCPGGRISGDKK